MICVEFFSNKINRCIFDDELFKEERTDAQNGPGHCHYALVLFSNILTILRDNSEMFDMNTRIKMLSQKKMLNQQIFKEKFLPAYNKSAKNDISFAYMSRDKRQQLYETSKKYGNSELDKKPKKNILTENDFTAIFENMKI